MPSTVVRKITTKTITGDMNLKEACANGPVALYQVIGIASGYGEKTTQYGQSTYITGEFIARSFKGESYHSERVYFPAFVAEQISDQLKNRKDETSNLEFCVEIGVVKSTDPKNSKGYEYTCKHIRDSKEENRLAHLLGKLPPMIENSSKTKAA